jgi:hypothetical protein
MEVLGPMISYGIVETVDKLLDENVAQTYKDQPLAQDWARVCKVSEELGEAVNELILLTGQNPRKPTDPLAYSRMLAELADTAMSAVYAIQHFTKNVETTGSYMINAQLKHQERLINGTPG